jgi:hypothetical protein
MIKGNEGKSLNLLSLIGESKWWSCTAIPAHYFNKK